MPKLKMEFHEEGSAKVSVFNGFNQRVVDSIDSSNSEDLPSGLYSVQIRRGSDITEKIVHLKNEDEVVKIDAPPHYTAVPLFGTATTHEYYADNSKKVSREETAEQIGSYSDGEIGELFIFIRAASQDNYDGEPLARGLGLLCARTEALITTFGSNDVKQDTDNGWLGYSVKAYSGYYRLRFEDEARELPIHVYKGWQTQVFITYNKGPKSDSITILMSRVGTGFDPSEKQQLAVDLALQSLKTGSGWLPSDAMQLLLYSKFQSPILGLLAGHLLLRREEQSSKPNDERRNTIQTVLGNLRWLIGDAPDVLALETRAALLFGDDVQGVAMEPPMIRLGNEALIKAASQNIQLVPEESEIARWAESLYADSVWTSWFSASSRDLISRKNLSLGNGLSNEPVSMSIMNHINGIDDIPQGPVFTTETNTDHNWVKNAIVNQISSDETFDKETMVKLALDMGLPQSVLIHQLKDIAIEKNQDVIKFNDVDDFFI